jgi:hypothetical protein
MLCTTAESTCVDNGMNLFAANDQGVYDALISATTSLLDQKYAGAVSLRFWINGKKTTSGWKTYTPNEADLYPNAKWYFNDPDAGDRLTIYKATLWSPTVFSGTDCSIAQQTYCEFYEP